MIFKIILTILAVANGVFMTIDGFHVLFKGKYIGPEKPGPWATIFYKMKIDVFKLGPLFVLLGLSWLLFVYGLWMGHDWTFVFGLIVSIGTLWYIKVGTFIAIFTMAILVFFKNQLGI
ncbi:MAG: hypothetical protein COB60_12660 [Flavobacteriaceae bacterium]|nr:MAG: hypothetical protein COB60_12660 [Flavobacteriaceae bacterium]